jgi:hypothetical protein
VNPAVQYSPEKHVGEVAEDDKPDDGEDEREERIKRYPADEGRITQLH